ncbi:hypothetical protein HDV62DRAFT_366013 [Trichoderma sp. SZMC 28011]
MSAILIPSPRLFSLFFFSPINLVDTGTAPGIHHILRESAYPAFPALHIPSRSFGSASAPHLTSTPLSRHSPKRPNIRRPILSEPPMEAFYPWNTNLNYSTSDEHCHCIRVQWFECFILCS